MRFDLNSDKAETVARRRAKQLQQQKKKIAKQQRKLKLSQQRKVKRVQKKQDATLAGQKRRRPVRKRANRRTKKEWQLGVLEISAIAFLLLAVPVVLFVLWMM